jgi:DNA-binding SARP family transcriptional activator
MPLQVHLLGPLTFQTCHADRPDHPQTFTLESGRSRELLAYLILHPQAHVRERLASHLWADITTERAMKVLRQALWQLQTALEQACDTPALLVQGDTIQLHPNHALELDIAAFDCACRACETLSLPELPIIQHAQSLYRGDLLSGWDHEWCLYERERLQNAHVNLLDHLMDHAERQGQYAQGIRHGTKILEVDRARECTHQRLMRLHHLNGDRTAAIRQYERCCEALNLELGIEPARKTKALLEAIRTDTLEVAGGPMGEAGERWAELMGGVQRLQVMLEEFKRAVQGGS